MIIPCSEIGTFATMVVVGFWAAVALVAIGGLTWIAFELRRMRE